MWEKIWKEGVRLSRNEFLKSDQGYSIKEDHNKNRKLGNTKINDPLWINSVKQALMGNSPSSAFEYWKEQGWLKHALPELDSLWGRIQPEKYHPEIDVGIHIMMVIDRSAHHNLALESRLACLFHDFGKSLTPLNEPSHINHEEKGVPLVENYLNLWDLDEKTKDIIRTVTLYHGDVHSFENRNSIGALKLIENMAFLENDYDRNSKVLNAIICDDQGRKNMFYSEARGVKSIAKMVNSLNKSKNKFDEIAETMLMKREALSSDSANGGSGYSIEKRERLKKEIIYNLKLKIITKDIKELTKNKSEESEHDHTRVRNKKNRVTM